MTVSDVLAALAALPRKDSQHILVSDLNRLVKELGKDHDLACKLWATADKNAREIACRIAEPDKMDEKLLDQWVSGIDEWGLCDAFAGHVVCATPYAGEKARLWARDEREFVRRASFATLAQTAWSKKRGRDWDFRTYLPLIESHARDPRFYVKKAVNWALRDIGKRDSTLHGPACDLAEKLAGEDDKTARWIGEHALRELSSGKVIERIMNS